MADVFGRQPTGPSGRRSPVGGFPSAGDGGVRRSLADGYRYLQTQSGVRLHTSIRLFGGVTGDGQPPLGVDMPEPGGFTLPVLERTLPWGIRSRQLDGVLFEPKGSRPEGRRRRVLAPLPV